MKDRIFKLSPIHASVIYQSPWIHWNHQMQWGKLNTLASIPPDVSPWPQSFFTHVVKHFLLHLKNKKQCYIIRSTLCLKLAFHFHYRMYVMKMWPPQRAFFSKLHFCADIGKKRKKVWISRLELISSALYFALCNFFSLFLQLVLSTKQVSLLY